MGLAISKQIFTEILAHSSQAAPIAACGYLAAGKQSVEQLYRLSNRDQAADHFTMEPAEQFSVIKKIRSQGLVLRALYHSHLLSPALPSAEDIRWAADPHISYVILSLQDRKPPIIKSFIIQKGQVAEEQVTIID